MTNCPRCDSPDPKLHPAVQHGGEVHLCPHPYHDVAPSADPPGNPHLDTPENVQAFASRLASIHSTYTDRLEARDMLLRYAASLASMVPVAEALAYARQLDIFADTLLAGSASQQTKRAAKMLRSLSRSTPDAGTITQEKSNE